MEAVVSRWIFECFLSMAQASIPHSRRAPVKRPLPAKISRQKGREGVRCRPCPRKDHVEVGEAEANGVEDVGEEEEVVDEEVGAEEETGADEEDTHLLEDESD